jgi:hypothetical protein
LLNKFARATLFGPYPGAEHVHGVTFDGQRVWFASGEKLNAIDPDTGNPVDSVSVPAHAGTAFDGQHLFRIADDRINKIDPKTGKQLNSIPAPEGGSSGLAWAEGMLLWRWKQWKAEGRAPPHGHIGKRLTPANLCLDVVKR